MLLEKYFWSHFCTFYFIELGKLEEKTTKNDNSIRDATCGCPVVQAEVKIRCWLTIQQEGSNNGTWDPQWFPEKKRFKSILLNEKMLSHGG